MPLEVPTKAPLCGCQNISGKGGQEGEERRDPKNRDRIDAAAGLQEIKMLQPGSEGVKTQVQRDKAKLKSRVHSVRPTPETLTE